MRVFICSPYSGAVAKNRAIARRLARLAFACGHTPLIPHLMYPGVLKDEAHERDAGIKAGLEWLDLCQAIWMFRGINCGASNGMRIELDHNVKVAGLPVFEIPPHLLRPWPIEVLARYIVTTTYLLRPMAWEHARMELIPRRDLWWWKE